MASAESVKEIERALNSEFALRGWGGTVVVRGDSAELHGHGTVLAIELGEWLEQWELLPPDMRSQHVQQAAGRLYNCLPLERRMPGDQRGPLGKLKRLVTLAAIPATVVGLLYMALNKDSEADPAPPPVASKRAKAAVPVLDPATRSRDVCEAARRRLYAGASMGVDVAGWVVEIWLARRRAGIAEDVNLDEFKEREQVTEQLATTVPGKVVTVRPRTKIEGLSQVTLRLQEGFVPPFMQRIGRPRYVQMMHRAADALGADYAALYARCAHLRFRDVGAAYRANDAKGVAASVLWIQGSTIDPPAFAPAILKGRKDGLAYLAEAQSSLSIELLREESLRAGGRVTQSAVENSKRPWVAVSFGLGAPIRAQKLARSLAQRAKLGGAR